MSLQPFLWGRNGRALTPDQVEREREMAEIAKMRGASTAPVGHWTQGAARVVDALGGVLRDRRANAAEEAGLASADAAVSGNPILSALFGGDQAAMATPSPVATVSGSPVEAALSGGLPGSIVQTESGGNWNALNGEGYGGRGQFGAERLADAARAGIIPAGMTGAEYSRQPESVQLAVENWHKNDIMGDLGQYVGVDVDGAGPVPPLTENSIIAVAHLGGTGGAKKFIESGGAYNPSDSNGTSLSDYATRHAGGASSPVAAALTGGAVNTGPSPVMAALAQAQSNPWVAQKYGPMIDVLMGQETRRSDAAFEQQMRQSDPMYQAQLQQAQLELEQARNPVPKQQALMNAGNGQIFDPNTGEWITAPGAGQQFRPATSQEAGGYGAAAGQFGPDGRFYPINPPSGLAIETGPDGQMRVVQGAGAGSAAGKPFTEGQSKDNVYATRAEGSLAALDPIAGALTSRSERAAEGVPFGLARGMQSDDFQLAKNAGDEFLQAILRKDTGAAITPDEQALYGVTYLPQPGDGAAVIAQKQEARRRAVEAIKAGMSPAQMIAQERALQNSGSEQLPPVQQAQPTRRRYNPQTGAFE